jgi:HTH-type transcriptional regulator/antitoxin HigA
MSKAAGTKTYEYRPDGAVAPGATLHQWLDANGMSQAEFARRTSLSTKHVNQVTKGTAGLSPDVALAFENVTGIPARFWNQLEANYKTHEALVQERVELSKHVDLLKSFPTTELVRRKALVKIEDPVAQLRELLRFFGVASIEALEATRMADARLRTSRAFAPDQAALSSWLRIAELKARKMKVSPFDPVASEAAIADFRSFTTLEGMKWWDALVDRCASVGIALVKVKELPKCHINGATQWISTSRPMIALSLRHLRVDVVWFTFFHELRHLLHHSRKQTFIDATGSQVPADLERDADRFAGRVLIAPEHEFALRSISNKTDAIALANRLGIDVSIIVGRLQHENLVPFSKWNDLVRKIPAQSAD